MNRLPESITLVDWLRRRELHSIPSNKNKLIRITAFNLETRYPDYKRGFRKKCTRDFTTHELAKIDKVL